MNTLIFAGVVMALTQVIKIAFVPNKRFIPLIAVIIGMLLYGIGILTGDFSVSFNSIIDSLIAVLSALGLYSGVKASVGK